MSITPDDLSAFTYDEPGTIALSQAEHQRMVEILNHHRVDRATTAPAEASERLRVPSER